jgi:hypothetical protein
MEQIQLENIVGLEGSDGATTFSSHPRAFDGQQCESMFAISIYGNTTR